MSWPVWLFGPEVFPAHVCPRCKGEDHHVQGAVSRAHSEGAKRTGVLYGCFGCGLAFGVVSGRIFVVGDRALNPIRSAPEGEGGAPAGPDSPLSGPRKVTPLQRRDEDLAWGDR